jgi:protocatechuate 3,4-dioxygenase beta subunit
MRRPVLAGVALLALAVAVGGVLLTRRDGATPQRGDARGRSPGLSPPPAPDEPKGGATEEAPPPAPTPAVVLGTVVDTSGTPIEGAVVDFPRIGELGAVLTDAQGRFRLPIARAASGTELRVRARGFVEQWIDGPPPGESIRVEMAAGRAILGRVLDPDGNPVAGALARTAESRISPATTKSAGGAIDTSWFDLVGRDETDSIGRFALNDLSEGAHVVWAEAPGFARSEETTVKAPVAGVEIRLRKGATLHGVVRDREGRPVEGAEIGWSERGDRGSLGAQTDAEGRFRKDGLLDAPVHDFVVWKQGFALFERELVRPRPEPMTIVLEPGRTLSLRVRRADGTTVTHPSITLRAPDGTIATPMKAETVGDVLRLEALGEGPFSARVEEFECAGAWIVDLKPSSPPTEVALKKEATITGSVTPAASEATLIAWPAGVPPPPPARKPWELYASPNESQVVQPYEPQPFEIRGLAEGRHDVILVFRGGGYASAVLPGVEAGQRGIEIRATAGGESVEGLVAKADGTPVAFDEVHAYDEKGYWRGTALPDEAKPGAFEVEGLPPGRYRLVAWLEEGSATLDRVTAPAKGVRIAAR